MTKQAQRRTVIVLALIAAAAAACVCIFCLGRPPAREPAGRTPAYLAGGDGALLALNTATADELEDLPGVGPVLAEAILDRRAELGSFRTEEDVLSVPGIGPATYEKIAPYITY